MKKKNLNIKNIYFDSKLNEIILFDTFCKKLLDFIENGGNIVEMKVMIDGIIAAAKIKMSIVYGNKVNPLNVDMKKIEQEK